MMMPAHPGTHLIIGQACMSVLRQTFSDTVAWIIEGIEGDNWDFNRIKVQLALP